MVFFGYKISGDIIDQMYTIVCFSAGRVRCEYQLRYNAILVNILNLYTSSRTTDISTTSHTYRLVLFQLVWKHKKLWGSLADTFKEIDIWKKRL